MKTALDIDAASLNEHEKSFVEQIRMHGWFGTHVFEDANGPGFSYTTGFWRRFAFPELILFPLPNAVSHEIFWNFFHDLEEQKLIRENEPISGIFDGFDVVLKKVRTEHFPAYFGWSQWFYRGDNFEAIQLFFPDKAGRFP